MCRPQFGTRHFPRISLSFARSINAPCRVSEMMLWESRLAPICCTFCYTNCSAGKHNLILYQYLMTLKFVQNRTVSPPLCPAALSLPSAERRLRRSCVAPSIRTSCKCPAMRAVVFPARWIVVTAGLPFYLVLNPKCTLSTSSSRSKIVVTDDA
jgi:hypothetical protein